MAMASHVRNNSNHDGMNLTLTWRKLTQGSQILSCLSEYAKLAKLAITLIIGSVEDERTFSRLEYIKNKKRNRLVRHLDLCVRAFEQKYYTLHTFPFDEAIVAWKNAPSRARYGTLCENEALEGEENINDIEG